MSPHVPEQAQQIVVAYAARLDEHAASGRQLLPLSTLPYPKAVIRQAIQTVTSAVFETKQMTGPMNEFLEAAYVALADYVDDDLARLLSQHFDAGAALEAEGAIGKEKTKTAAWRVAAETGPLVGRIGQAIAQESAELRLEYQRFCEREASRPSKAARQGEMT